MLKLRLKLPLKLLIPLLIIALFAVYSFAAWVSVTTTTIASESGVFFNVVGSFSAASNGFLVVQSSAVASTLPVTWSNGGTVQTALTAGNWYYSFTLTINANATVSHTYTVTVSWNTGSGYAGLGTSLTFTTLGTITQGQTMTFLFDTGLTGFNAPAALTITVA